MIDKRAHIPSQGNDVSRVPWMDYSGRRDGYGIIEADAPQHYIPVFVECRDLQGNILSWNKIPGSSPFTLAMIDEAKEYLTSLAKLSGSAIDRMRQAQMRRHLKLG